MKTSRQVPEDDVNRLCRTCRRTCKQPAALLIASCPRYYGGMKPEKRPWRQMPLPLTPVEGESGET